jgi:hypothetical protein
MIQKRIASIVVTAVGAFAACATSGGNLAGVGATTGSAGTGASTICAPCLQDSDCASASYCGQFAGDQFCAPDCSSTACPSGTQCTPVNGANGVAHQLCVPTSNVCGTTSGGGGATGAGAGPTGTGAGATTTTTTAATTSSGSPDTCTHSPCSNGAALLSGCDPCATAVCAGDSYCCSKSWDAECVTEAMSTCGASCAGSTAAATSSSTGASSSSGTTSSGAPGTIGPSGGSLAELNFAVVGDTRPPNEDDTAGYPTSIITSIFKNVAAAKPAFAITTGDYMFASPTHTPGTQSTQMGYYMSARNQFPNVVFPVMGNHECDGATADNCAPCSACSNVGGTCVGAVCETPNFKTWSSAMLAPINQTNPYYSININSTSGAWTSKFVFVACNMWTSAQATWLDSVLSTPTTYTFVVRHQPPGTATSPCVTASPSADSITTSHPFTLIIAGHTHEYAYYSSEKLVVAGNGGAPLTGSGNYGYLIAKQSGSSIVFTEYDYTGAQQTSFTVQ